MTINKWTEDRLAAAGLATLDAGPDHQTLHSWSLEYNYPDVWHAAGHRFDLASSLPNVQAIAAATDAASLRFVTPDDADWPGWLRSEISPFGLWVAGDGSDNIAASLTNTVAFTGPDTPSQDARELAWRLTEQLVDAARPQLVTIVATDAGGIDTSVRTSALHAETFGHAAVHYAIIRPAFPDGPAPTFSTTDLNIALTPPGRPVDPNTQDLARALVGQLASTVVLVEPDPGNRTVNAGAFTRQSVIAVKGVSDQRLKWPRLPITSGTQIWDRISRNNPALSIQAAASIASQALAPQSMQSAATVPQRNTPTNPMPAQPIANAHPLTM